MSKQPPEKLLCGCSWLLNRSFIYAYSAACLIPLSTSFGRSLLKQPYAAWYATHTGSPSGHHQWRLKSDEEKERMKRGRERERGKKMKERILYTVYEKRHSISKRRPCFDRSVLIWWTVAQRLQLLGLPSYPLCHRLQSNFCHQTFSQLFVYSVFLCFIKPHHSELADSAWNEYLGCLYPS